MRWGFLIVACCVLPWAAHAAHGNTVSGQKAAAGVASSPTDQSSAVKQRLANNQVQVRQLQQLVDRQQVQSEQASQRLQQQDQAIADLRRQLQNVRSASKSQGPAPVSH